MKFYRLVALVLTISLGFSSISAPLVSTKAYAANSSSTDSGSIGEQIASDLIGAGVSIAASLTGNVPLAFLAGYISKYLSTYGIQGVKWVIDYFKGYQPQDLGEINIYYVYLLHVKRNLYQGLINIRKQVDADDALANLRSELDRIQGVISGECSTAVAAGKDCAPTGLDDSLVNTRFLDLILDAKEQIEITKVMTAYEIKNSYQYLMLLYMDLVIVEQKLIEAQYNVMVNRTLATIELLKDNDYLSNAEKEFQTQLLLNMSLRWMKLADQRRVIVAKAVKEPLRELRLENDQLRDEIERYRNAHNKGAGFLVNKDASGASDGSDAYDQYMRRVQEELQSAGTHVDAFGQNPFQTGTALSGYFLNEKTLLLERDAFFQMKANKLKTTEEIADFQYRTKVLRAHGNNLLLQLIQAVDQRNREGFTQVEEPKHQQTLEQLIEECKKDARCVSDRLTNPETNLQNILVDNFALATQVFKQIPYMHALEVDAVYQLVQLVYLEVFYDQNMLSGVEFDVFLDKQKALDKQIRDNRNLTSAEKDFHRTMVVNTVSKWKKRILERKYDHVAEFKAKATDLVAANKRLYGEVEKIRHDNASLFKGIYDRKEGCFDLFHLRKWRWCKARKKLLNRLDEIPEGKFEFLNEKESKLPKKFWPKDGKDL